MDAPNAHADDLAVAHRLADAAARVSMSFFGRSPKQWKKADDSLVTEADIAVETELRSILARERPDDAILGEEAGASGSGPRRWILDAIDGTVDFAKGTPHWGTLIALEVDGRLVVGVFEQPVHHRRYWATRGGGAYLREEDLPGAPRRLAVTAAADLADARSYVPAPKWAPDDRARRISEHMLRATQPRSVERHPALQVAEGGYELVVFHHAGPWDLAAPALIVEEAGGRFTDITGDSNLAHGTAIFSNGRVHDAFLASLQTIE